MLAAVSQPYTGSPEAGLAGAGPYQGAGGGKYLTGSSEPDTRPASRCENAAWVASTPKGGSMGGVNMPVTRSPTPKAHTSATTTARRTDQGVDLAAAFVPERTASS